MTIKSWTAIDRLSVIWKSDLTAKIKRSFFPAAIRMHYIDTNYGEKAWQQLHKNAARKSSTAITRECCEQILNKSGRQHSTKQSQYGYLPLFWKTIQVSWSRHGQHYWRSKDELISDIFLWNASHGQAKAGWLARFYTQQLWADTGCCLEDPPPGNDGG